MDLFYILDQNQVIKLNFRGLKTKYSTFLHLVANSYGEHLWLAMTCKHDLIDVALWFNHPTCLTTSLVVLHSII